MRRAAAVVAVALAACSAEPPPPAAPVPVATPPVAASPAVAAPEPTAPEPAAAAATPAPQRALQLPGMLSRATTRADLERHWGAANVRASDALPGAEGERLPGIVLHPDDPARRAYLYLDDAGRLETVRVFDRGSRWQLDTGIGIGTPIAELVRLNGGPLRFMGTGWDYGGWVTDWRGGRLAESADAAVRRRVRLELADDVDTDGTDLPIGEGEFEADDPRWPRLDARVSEIAVDFGGTR